MKDLILDHKDELRMYGLVAYQLSGTIHAGIQFGHAVVEYGLKHGKSHSYTQWAENNKTFIVLNGGTTNKRIIDDVPFGTLNQHAITLRDELDVKIAEFYEPDLGEQLTATVFLVPKQVYNKKEFPNFMDYVNEKFEDNIEMAKFINLSYKHEDMYSNNEVEEVYMDWLDLIGGSKIESLRKFLSQFERA